MTSIPRPEYPRPDFERETWINLNGKWGFSFDDYDIGLKEEWYKNISYNKDIVVPYPYQSRLSRINDKCFHNIVWYFKTFKVSEYLLSKRAFLKFGAVDYETKVWLNGRYIGSHIGGYSPFEFEVSKLLKPENVLVLRVLDMHEDQPRGKQSSDLYPKGCLYMRTTGIWQTVWIDFTGSSRIKSYTIYPSLNNAKISIFIDNMDNNLTLEVKALYTGYEVFRTIKRVKENIISLLIIPSEIKLWYPETPNIYKIVLILKKKDKILDKISGIFGLRVIKVKNRKILINNKEYFLNLALDQGYNPLGLYSYPNDSYIKKDIEIVKKLGFIGVRKHQKPEDPRYFYWADKIGILVWEEMADWGMRLIKSNFKKFWEEWKSILLRDFNHPSIIAWVPFNERKDAFENEEASNFILKIYRLTKKLDPTRLVIDTSGYSHTETDIVDIHDYNTWKGEEYIKSFWKELDNISSIKAPYSFLFAKGFKYENQPIVISEWGGFGIKGFKPILNRPMSYYGPLLDDEYDFLNKYRDVINAFRSIKKITGICYTQLYDVEGEVNGILTYDRKLKVPLEEFKKINQH